MAGIRGSQAYWAASKQSGKGEVPTEWQNALAFSGGNIMPTHETDQLSETDASRNAGDFFVTQTGVSGSPEAYVRTDSIHHLLEYALGSAEHEGSSEEYTHTIAPASSVPYVTFAKGLGATLYEQYNDCKVDELSISWATGAPGTASLSLMGLAAIRQTEAWKEGGAAGSVKAAIPSLSEVAPLNWNKALVKLGGSETRLISSFDLTINNGITVQQTDDSVPFDVVEGTLAVTMGFDLIFESLTEYNKFHYGEAAGTKQSPDIFTTSLEVTVGEGYDQVTFVFPKIAYQEFPVEPDPGGAPVVASVRGASQRDEEGFVVATVKNAIAT